MGITLPSRLDYQGVISIFDITPFLFAYDLHTKSFFELVKILGKFRFV